MAANTMLAGCGDFEEEAAVRVLADLGIPGRPVGPGYGTDPDLLHPEVPWARTMTELQLRLAGVLADMVLPATETSPAASKVGVPDFIDEWVSAPYPNQQNDRETVFEGLTWLEQESLNRFSVPFDEANDAQRRQVLDDIAFRDRIKPGYDSAAIFFTKFRHLAMSAYYSTNAGIQEIGYIGNQPLPGDYPGPTPEAMAHLNTALSKLGLA